MKFYHFSNGQPACPLDRPIEALPETGFIWLDCERGSGDWEAAVRQLAGVEIEPDHSADAGNPAHPSYFEGTPAHDMLIFEGLGPSDEPIPLETRAAAFFLFDRLLVTVRAPDNVSFGRVQAKLCDGHLRAPGSVPALAHLVLDVMMDRFLAIRAPLDLRLTFLQDELLNPDNRVTDWRPLLEGRRVARQLEALCENQLEALDAWRRGSRFSWSTHDEVRMHDLIEHAGRVLQHASGQERDLEAAVQLHFASVAHRTNRIVRALTAMSAIFFPLTLITGVYGMNFEHMPELSWRYGYLFALGLLLAVGGGLLWYLKRQRLL